MVALPKPSNSSHPMTVEQFMAWDPGNPEAWQLVDGEAQAMAPASPTHARIQNEAGRLLGNHLLGLGSPCSVLTTPGVQPQVNASGNLRVPDLGVTCSDPDIEGGWLTHPILLIEILSPSNKRETWLNIWAYTSIPSVQELLLLGSEDVLAKLLRRQPDGTWPPEPETVTEGNLVLDSIGFRAPLMDFYRTTRLHKSGP